MARQKGVEHSYDYTMRDIVIDHVACGVARGRCSFPDCGIGVDSLFTGHLKTDYDSMDECVADNQDKENPAAFCAWLLKQTGVCTQDQVNAYLSKRGKKSMSEDPKEAFIKGKIAEGLTKEQAEVQYVELTSKPVDKIPPQVPTPEKSVPTSPKPEIPVTPPTPTMPPLPAPTTDALVTRNRELLKMKVEKDFQKQIDQRKRRS